MKVRLAVIINVVAACPLLNVSDEGANWHERPAGNDPQLKLIVPLKFPTDVAVTVRAADWPDRMTALLGFADNR